MMNTRGNTIWATETLPLLPIIMEKPQKQKVSLIYDKVGVAQVFLFEVIITSELSKTSG